MTTVFRTTIGFGDYGATDTLAHMRRLVNDALAKPFVNEYATGIVSTVPSRDYLRMALAIRHWLDRNFKFVPDPVGVELLRDPERQLLEFRNTGRIIGDCDDAAVLGAALGKSVGIRAKFVAVGFRTPGPLAHVYTVLTGPVGRAIGLNGAGVDLDVTRPRGAALPIARRIERAV